MNVQRMLLIINGIEREVLCEPEESLAAVVRRLGLTGTKIGCGTGQCGACTLLLDGKPVRSCIRLMKKIKPLSRIDTIEGLGTAARPHPLQKAFLTYAAVQCGFCSPGFIMSAKGLLDENPAPTREQVRDWFTSHNNICRCTGYKPIIDAIMAAAAVMRGEQKPETLDYVPPADGHIYGTGFPKPTGLTRVLGSCDFGADIAQKMPQHGAFHLAVVLARRHHARILGIQTEAAEAMPGVARVLTVKDVRGTNRFVAAQGTIHSQCHGHERPVFCEDTVHRWGDIVAVVAAATREQARAAAARVVVDYADLPAVLSFEEAAAPGAARVHDDLPNIYAEQPLFKGADTRPYFTEERQVSGHFSTTRQPHLSIEPDVIQAYPQDGGITIQCKTQYIYGIIGQMAAAIGLPKEKLRVIGNPAGGSFGYSMSPGNYAVAAACALTLDAPVSLELSYEEHMHTTGKRSPIQTTARLACDAHGRMTAMEFLVGLDHGAYSEMAGALTTKVLRFFGYPYAIPNLRGLVRLAFSNNNFGTAFQAFGSPQAYMASEQLVDMLARKMRMDPFEFRYLNVARPGDLCPTSVPYREYPMQEMMDQLRPVYNDMVRRARAASTDSVRHGVGVAWGGYHVSKVPDHAEVDLELNEDGSITVWNTWADVGQGSDLGTLGHAHEALLPLGLKPEQIHMVRNDSATCPDTGSASGSRSHHTAGRAIMDAADKLLRAMRKDDGTFRTWGELRAEGLETRYRGVYADKWADIDPDTGHGWGAVAQNYMLFLVGVEVELATGKVTVNELHELADVGKIGSLHGVLGQAWGGFVRSLGYALSEDYSDMKKHTSMRACGIPRCNDAPDEMDIRFHVTPRENGPNGSTGCAEGFQSAGHAAILNAIADATGVRITTLPATPAKIKSALDALAKGAPCEQRAWQLGCDLHERLEELRVAAGVKTE